MLVQMLVFWDGSYRCRDDVVVLINDGFCAFGGGLLYWTAILSTFWICSISLHVFLSVFVGVSKSSLEFYLKIMWIVNLSVPTIATIIMAAFDLFGNLVIFSAPFCFFKVVDSGDDDNITNYFSIPFLIMYIIGSLFMLITMFKVYQYYQEAYLKAQQEVSDREQSVATEGEYSEYDDEEVESDVRSKKAWKKMLQYNQRSILFVFFICILGIVAASSQYFLSTKTKEVKDNSEVYLTCILTTASTLPAGLSKDDVKTYPLSVCGEPDQTFDYWGLHSYTTYWLLVR